MDTLSDLLGIWLQARGRSAALVEVIPYAVVIATGLCWYIRGLARDAYRDLRFQIRRRRFRSVGRNATEERPQSLLRHYLGEFRPAAPRTLPARHTANAARKVS